MYTTDGVFSWNSLTVASSSVCSFLGVVTTKADACPTSVTSTANETASDAARTMAESRREERASLGLDGIRVLGARRLGFLERAKNFEVEKGLIERRDRRRGGGEGGDWRRKRGEEQVAVAAVAIARGTLQHSCCLASYFNFRAASVFFICFFKRVDICSVFVHTLHNWWDIGISNGRP